MATIFDEARVSGLVLSWQKTADKEAKTRLWAEIVDECKKCLLAIIRTYKWPLQVLGPTYGTKMREVVEPLEELLLKTTHGPKWHRIEGSDHNAATLGFLTKRWLEELARRRCVWCWNQSTNNL